jgi:hypothetical protein
VKLLSNDISTNGSTTVIYYYYVLPQDQDLIRMTRTMTRIVTTDTTGAPITSPVSPGGGGGSGGNDRPEAPEAVPADGANIFGLTPA